MYYRSIGRQSSIPLITSVTMADSTRFLSTNRHAIHTDVDHSSVGSNASFLGDVDVLTSMLSGARVEDVAASKDAEEEYEIKSDSSFVGYIDGVHSFPSSNTDGEHVGVKTSDLECTVATSESTDDTLQEASGVHLRCVDKLVKKSKKTKGKGVKDVLLQLEAVCVRLH